MTEIDVWLTLVGLMVVTIFTRSAFLLAGSRLRLSDRVQSGLRYAPVAALVAIIVPDVMAPTGELQISLFTNPRLIAAVISVSIFLLTRHVLATLLGGIAAFYCARALIAWCC